MLKFPFWLVLKRSAIAAMAKPGDGSAKPGEVSVEKGGQGWVDRRKVRGDASDLVQGG